MGPVAITTANPITPGSTGLAFQKFTNTALTESGFRALASTLTADLDINTQKITNVADPTNAQDAATKAYVDSVVGGSFTEADLRTASAALTATMSVNGQVISDGACPAVRTMPRQATHVDNAAANEANLRFAAATSRPALTLTARRSPLAATPATSTDAATKGYVDGLAISPPPRRPQRSDRLAAPGRAPLPAK